MTSQTLGTKEMQWLHISKLEENDLALLQKDFRFHHLDYEDIRTRSSLSKIDTYKHYLFFIFHVPTFDPISKNVGKEELYVFLADKQIVTLSHCAHKSVEELYQRLERGNRFRATALAKGSAYLLYLILMEAFRESRQIASVMGQEVNRLENAINHRYEKAITVDLGRARRNVLYLRHVIDPQRNIIASLLHIKRPFIPEEVFVYYDDLQDNLDTIGITADNLKLLLDGLFDVNEALLSHRTNDVITMLTVVTATLTAPTLLVGFYGMNVPWLPFVNDPRTFFFLFSFSFLLVLLVMLFIVRRHHR
jgi:magnesium transporter